MTLRVRRTGRGAKRAAACLVVDGDPAVVLPGGLLGVVLQLHVEAHGEERAHELVHPSRVVVPAPSVHVGAVRHGERRGALRLARVQGVVHVGSGVLAGHGLLACLLACAGGVCVCVCVFA